MHICTRRCGLSLRAFLWNYDTQPLFEACLCDISLLAAAMQKLQATIYFAKFLQIPAATGRVRIRQSKTPIRSSGERQWLAKSAWACAAKEIHHRHTPVRRLSTTSITKAVICSLSLRLRLLATLAETFTCKSYLHCQTCEINSKLL